MFVAGAVVIGGIIIAHSDHSRYGDHSNHSNHSRYGDASMLQAIVDKQSEIEDRDDALDNLRDEMENRFKERVAELQEKRYYDSLDYSEPYEIIDNVREEMREELETEIQQEKAELARIDEMIARINELELQAKRE